MKRLYRSESDRKIAGICGGIGEVFGMDPTLVRLVFFFLALASGVLPLALTYLVGWVISATFPVISRHLYGVLSFYHVMGRRIQVWAMFVNGLREVQIVWDMVVVVVWRISIVVLRKIVELNAWKLFKEQ